MSESSEDTRIPRAGNESWAVVAMSVLDDQEQRYSSKFFPFMRRRRLNLFRVLELHRPRHRPQARA